MRRRTFLKALLASGPAAALAGLSQAKASPETPPRTHVRYHQCDDCGFVVDEYLDTAPRACHCWNWPGYSGTGVQRFVGRWCSSGDSAWGYWKSASCGHLACRVEMGGPPTCNEVEMGMPGCRRRRDVPPFKDATGSLETWLRVGASQ